MSKEPLLSLIESLVENSKEFTEQKVELIKLKAVDKSAKIFSIVVTTILLLIFFVIFFLMLSIGLGFFIGDLLGETYLGFFILAAFYAIVGLVLYLGKRVFLRNPLANRLIRKIL